MNDELNTTVLTNVTSKLANNLGLTPEDIDPEDTFLDDLHMQPTEFSDFLEELNDSGMNTTRLDLTEIKSVADLVEALSSHEYIE
jgi:hypothetical protein